MSTQQQKQYAEDQKDFEEVDADGSAAFGDECEFDDHSAMENYFLFNGEGRANVTIKAHEEQSAPEMSAEELLAKDELFDFFEDEDEKQIEAPEMEMALGRAHHARDEYFVEDNGEERSEVASEGEELEQQSDALDAAEEAHSDEHLFTAVLDAEIGVGANAAKEAQTESDSAKQPPSVCAFADVARVHREAVHPAIFDYNLEPDPFEAIAMTDSDDSIPLRRTETNLAVNEGSSDELFEEHNRDDEGDDTVGSDYRRREESEHIRRDCADDVNASEAARNTESYGSARWSERRFERWEAVVGKEGRDATVIGFLCGRWI